MKLLNALHWRYAVREFNHAEVPDALINTLLDATRLSASSYGLQPYKLALVRSQDLKSRLLTHSYGQEKVLQSPLLIVFAAETNIGDYTVDRYAEELTKQRGINVSDIQGYVDHMKSALASKTEDQQQQWAHEQTYIALGNFLTSAAILGIDTCPMTGFDSQAYDQELGFQQKGLQTVAIATLGERSENDQSARDKKVRIPREDFILEYL